MLCAFEEMGIKLKRFDPEEDMKNIRFMFRNTMGANEARCFWEVVFAASERVREKRHGNSLILCARAIDWV